MAGRAATPMEIALVRTTAQLAVGTSSSDTLARLITKGLDWGKARNLAEFHGTIPLLEHSLSRLPEGIVPSSVRQALRDRCRAIAATNLVLTSRLTRACEALQAADIRALAFKGPTLAVLGYGDLSLRQFNDVDLLVAPADYEHALETLHLLGYGFAHRLRPSLQRQYVRTMGQAPLREARGTLLELHTTLTDRAYHFPLGFDDLWDRRQSVVLHEHAVGTLGTEDLLLYLAAHGTKHAWPCLGWVVDLVRLMERSQEIDWPRILERAASLRCRRVLLLSLELTRSTLGALLPAVVTEASAADRLATRLAEVRARRLWEGGTNPPESVFRRARFHLRSRERLRDGVSFLWATIFEAHLSDWQALDLPLGWEFLYPVTRPLRLVRKYARLGPAHGRP